MRSNSLEPSKLLFCIVALLVICEVGCPKEKSDDDSDFSNGESQIKRIKNALMDVDKELSRSLIFKFSTEGQMETLVYFMGMTGAGKSTLINYLLGNSLTFSQKGTRFKIAQTSPHPDSPRIGSTSSSETKIPQAYRDAASNILYVDTPGFMNTKGLIEQIADSYANSRIFTHGKKIKIVLVVDYQTLLAGRGQFLFKSATKIKQLFPKEFSEIGESMAIIITKANPETTPKHSIVEFIQESKEEYEDNGLDSSISALLEIILKNNRLYILPTPNHQSIDKYVQQIKEKLTKDASDKIKPYKLKKDAKLDLSAQARILVQKLGQSIQKSIRQSQQKILSLIQDKFQRYITIQEAEIPKVQSKDLRDIIEELASYSKIAADKNKLTPEQTKGFLTFVGVADQLARQELLNSLDYLRYCNSLHEYVSVSDFFQDLSEALLDIIGHLKITLEKVQNSESLQKLEDNHKKTINKVKQQVGKKYDEKMEQAQKAHDSKLTDLRNDLTAENAEKIKQLTQEHSQKMNDYKNQMRTEQEKAANTMKAEFGKQYNQLKNEMERKSQEEISALKQELNRVREQRVQYVEKEGGGGILGDLLRIFVPVFGGLISDSLDL